MNINNNLYDTFYYAIVIKDNVSTIAQRHFDSITICL